MFQALGNVGMDALPGGVSSVLLSRAPHFPTLQRGCSWTGAGPTEPPLPSFPSCFPTPPWEGFPSSGEHEV